MPDNFGEYAVVSTVACGTFGDVYKVEKDGRIFALKHITISSRENSVMLQLEVDAHKSLPLHPNIVKFVDHFKTTFTWNIVLEYCELGNLEVYIISNRPEKETLLSLMSDMARGLNHLHSNNIVHRDMKPENILLVKGHFGKPICKISDFGLARFGVLASNSDTSNGTVNKELYFQSLCGTPHFLAPEVRNKQYTRSCDIFSLGIVFYLLFRCDGNSETKLIPWVEDGTPFYRATDTQIKDQLKLHIHDDKIYNLVCSMLKVDLHGRVTAAGLVEELNVFQVSDDEVFVAALVLFALILMLVLFPFSLSVLIAGFLVLACWELELLPKSTLRKVNIFK